MTDEMKRLYLVVNTSTGETRACVYLPEVKSVCGTIFEKDDIAVVIGIDTWEATMIPNYCEVAAAIIPVHYMPLNSQDQIEFGEPEPVSFTEAIKKFVGRAQIEVAS